MKETLGQSLENVLEQTKNLFRRRAEPKLKDHYNFNLVKGIYTGINQVECNEFFAVPQAIHDQLDVYDSLALYYGLGVKQGIATLDHPKFETAVKHLIGRAYEFESKTKHAKNAIVSMKHKKLGSKQLPRTIEQRMSILDEDAKTQFMLAANSGRKYSQQHSSDFHYVDTVFEKYHNRNGQPIDSNKARDMYVDEIFKLLQYKQDHVKTPFVKAERINSMTDDSKEYLVTRMKAPISEKYRYSCTCPDHYYRHRQCKHIDIVKIKNAKQQKIQF